MPTPCTDTPQSSAPQYPPGLDVSKYVRALRRQQPGRLGGGQDLVGYALPCGEDQWPDPVTLGHPHRC